MKFDFDLNHESPPAFYDITENDNTSKQFKEYLINKIDPITDPISIFLRQRLLSVYNTFNSNAIFVSNCYLKILINPDDINGTYKLVKIPAALVSAYIANESVTLLEGSPGSAKTSAIQALSRLMTGTSIKAKANILHCNKSLDKDSWLAKIDPSKVMKDGEWKIIWAKWVKDKNIMDIIFDEINRASEDIQAQLLLIMQEVMVQYDIDFSEEKPDIRIFMTRNPSDEDGIHLEELGNAFKDRIMQVLQVPQGDSWAIERVEKTRAMEKFVGFNIDDYIQPIMNPNMIRMASLLSAKIPVDDDAITFLSYLIRDSNLCIRCPNFEKSFNEVVPLHDLCGECHFNRPEFACHKVSGGSFRIKKHLLSLARAYAFWIGIPSVNVNMIASIAPDVITHRLVIPMNELKDKKDRYYYDKRKYIINEYIDWCKLQLQQRKEAELAYKKLIWGKGKASDFTILLNRAQNDLYIRIDKLPRVIQIDNDEIAKNFYDKNVAFDPQGYASCLHPDYIKYIDEIRAQKANYDELEKILTKIEKTTSIPMRSLLIEIINDVMRELELKTQKAQWLTTYDHT